VKRFCFLQKQQVVRVSRRGLRHGRLVLRSGDIHRIAAAAADDERQRQQITAASGHTHSKTGSVYMYVSHVTLPASRRDFEPFFC